MAEINHKLMIVMTQVDLRSRTLTYYIYTIVTIRGEYFEKYCKIHWVIICWISLAGVEFVWKAWIFHEI